MMTEEEIKIIIAIGEGYNAEFKQRVPSKVKEITEEGVFKNGAVLFFGETPEKHFSYAVLRCVAFEGITKRYIRDDKTFGGPLFNQYLQALDWLKIKLDVGYKIEGQEGSPRKEVWEIPKDVFKEAIINALSHRDYYDKGATITIELFDNRVEISNPGGLVSAIPKSQFGQKSFTRNPLIFGLFQRMGMVEKIGSGIGRMRNLMKESELPYPDFNLEGIFSITVYRKDSGQIGGTIGGQIGGTIASLTKRQLQILNLINENNKISISAISSTLRINRSAVQKHIDILRTKGVIERIGGTRGFWKIIKPLGQ
ncbi:MAG: HTH domain-containing protein [Bacteroidales bacterium]|nr:HTH domain-containing protein [Bacteroidales bacterium]